MAFSIHYSLSERSQMASIWCIKSSFLRYCHYNLLLQLITKFIIMKLIALHGNSSNSSITRLQMENLGLSGPEYDVIYIDGPISVNKPHADIEGLVPGPWYSWFPKNTDAGELGSRITLDILLSAIQHVLTAMENEAPFNSIFGFSEGAWIASLLCGLTRNEVLRSSLLERTGGILPAVLHNGIPFRSAIIACAALPVPLSHLRSELGLGASPIPIHGPEFQSLHLIGRKDEYRYWSEDLALAMNSVGTNVYYLNGGHEVSPYEPDNTEIHSLVRRCLYGETISVLPNLEWRKSSDLSSYTIPDNAQIQTIKIETNDFPATIMEMLADQSATAPLFREARQQESSLFTTYGQVLSFCQAGGEGDLRRLGVQPGEVVAYLAPPGGNATAALMFLSIASQACAAPLDPKMSEGDAFTALNQYGATHIVMFEGVFAPGVEAAFERYTYSRKAKFHRAIYDQGNSPGLFKYLKSIDGFQNQPILTNSPDSYCLLLRTSGTTSVPKVVPLRQQDIVWNGVILADSIGITANDVTYSVMPLHHIGGISASILCSIAVGASITCDSLYIPEKMVEALVNSNPRPTWYSAVPTIHNATVRHLLSNPEISFDYKGLWLGHNLRMIRSGADTLKESDRHILEVTYGCEVISTYSMSEQMPICQPPKSNGGWEQKPGSVGVPVATSMAVVDQITLRPLPLGLNGEVAIYGPTVFTGYLDNPSSNQQSHFLMKSPHSGQLQRWFLTGDLGEVDSDGMLTLRGRIKELIKKGGEQVSPVEVENLLIQHEWIREAVCFSAPSNTYGEEVGCALVLESSHVSRVNLEEVIREMKTWLKKMSLSSYKFPTLWKLVSSEELPRTSSKKYIRKGLSDLLGVASQDIKLPSPLSTTIGVRKPRVDWSTLRGFQFLLSCYVMFMHIGSDVSFGAVANLRQFPWHVHSFFALIGFSLAVSMPSLIASKITFIKARVSRMYPLYAVAVIIGVIHLLVNCRPSTFSPDFHWVAQIGDIGRTFCEGTPILQVSWVGNLLLTLGIYLTGLQATPLWMASWFPGFYLWFMSMYFQCIAIFPSLYNSLYQRRGRTRSLLLLTGASLGINLLVLLVFWFGYVIETKGNTGTDNTVILSFYMFAPFWIVYFVAGICAAFLYDSIRPVERFRGSIWGYIADAITMIIIVVSIAHISQGQFSHGGPFFMRPEPANTFSDPALVNRIWDNIYARLFAPITLIWIFTLGTGQGLTARILKSKIVSETLAPTAYGCFLFHQIVGQWYYAITRGEWWNWWSYRKDFYWFSPQPCPVEWYEFFYRSHLGSF